MSYKIPLFDLNFDEKEGQAALETIQSKWISTGPKTAAFEEKFASMLGAKHAVALSNCTVSLHLALKLAGVQAGDEVICPSLTFVATVNSIRYVDAIPVFADVTSYEDPTIDPEDIRRKITPKTKAIMVMHYGGFACNMEKIMQIAQEHNLKVIEDACHGPLSEYKGKKLGTIGDVGCFSFFGNKNLTTAEGGMLVTDDPEIAQKVRVLRSHGMTTLTWDRFKGHASTYDVVAQGYNYRMDELRSALGREQLKRIPAGNARRGELLNLYRELLGQEVPAIRVPFAQERGQSSYHIMPALLPSGADKPAFMEQMKQQGIQTSWHYPPVHRFSVYKQAYASRPNPLPVTDEVAQREVTLPLYPTMTDEQVAWVVQAAKKALAGL